MSESNLVYKLDGDVRELDVFKLAPTLLALGHLIQESNRQLFPEDREVGVNVKPFGEGSFVVYLRLFAPSHLQQVIDFLTPHSIEQLQALLASIGLISTGVGFGAVQVIKFLKGKPKSVEEIGAGEFRYTSQDDNSITVSRQVNALLSNQIITQNIYNVFSQPMIDQTSVEDVKTYIEGQEAETQTLVTRSEIPVFREFSRASSPREVTEDTKETIHTGVFLNPKRGAFGDDPKDWSFWRGDEIITATIRDKIFLSKTANGEIRLNESDLLTVDLLERQRVRGTSVLRPIYEILRVTDYKKGAQQASIPLS